MTKIITLTFLNILNLLSLQTTQPFEAKAFQTTLFWDYLKTNSTTQTISASWLTQAAEMIFDSSIATTTNPHLQPALEGIKTLQQFYNTLNTLSLEKKDANTHCLFQINSIPLTKSQNAAIQEYQQYLLNSYQTDKDIAEYNYEHNTNYEQTGQKLIKKIINTFENWSYKDIIDVIKHHDLYNKEYSIDFNPWIYWLSEVFDIRLIKLPELNSYYICSTLSNDFADSFLKSFFPNTAKIDPDNINKAEAIFTQYLETSLKNNSTQQQFYLGEFAKLILSLYTSTALNEAQKIFLDECINHTQFTSKNKQVISMHLKLQELTYTPKNIMQKFKQLYRAQAILKTWDARNFQVLGNSDPNYLSHPIYGKMFKYTDNTYKQKYSAYTEDNKLLPALQKWDAQCYINRFPAELFTYSRKNQVASQYDIKDMIDCTDLLLDFFTFLRSSYGNPQLQSAIEKEDTYSFQVLIENAQTKEIEAIPLKGSLSIILQDICSIIEQTTQDNNKINKQTAVIQCFYQLLLSLAFTDNKFAQTLLNTSLPIYTTVSLNDDNNKQEAQSNIAGLLLSHIRSILISVIAKEPEYIEFILTYFPKKNQYGVDLNDGQCKVDLTQSTLEDPDFSTVYNMQAHTQEGLFDKENDYENIQYNNVSWISPFRLKPNSVLSTLAGNIWTINLIDILKQSTSDESLYITKQLDANNKLQLLAPLTNDNSFFFPACTTELVVNCFENILSNKADTLHINEICQNPIFLAAVDGNSKFDNKTYQEAERFARVFEDFIKEGALSTLEWKVWLYKRLFEHTD